MQMAKPCKCKYSGPSQQKKHTTSLSASPCLYVCLYASTHVLTFSLSYFHYFLSSFSSLSSSLSLSSFLLPRRGLDGSKRRPGFLAVKGISSYHRRDRGRVQRVGSSICAGTLSEKGVIVDDKGVIVDEILLSEGVVPRLETKEWGYMPGTTGAGAGQTAIAAGRRAGSLAIQCEMAPAKTWGHWILSCCQPFPCKDRVQGYSHRETNYRPTRRCHRARAGQRPGQHFAGHCAVSVARHGQPTVNLRISICRLSG